MKFHLAFQNNKTVYEVELVPAFVRGALAARRGDRDVNPYKTPLNRYCWDFGYRGIIQGTVTIEDE